MAAVRIGLVGAGFMGKIHSIAYRNAGMLFGGEIPSVDTVAVTDFDPALADRAVADWGWSRSVRSWEEVTTIRPDGAKALLEYYDAVSELTRGFLATVTAKDLDRVVDTRWNPPVTLGVRLVSIADDEIQHAGQANYVRGILDRR